MVSRRHLRLSARRMDLPRTGMETPYPESHYRSIVTPNLLPVAYAGSIQQVSPLFSGLYFVDSLFLVALYRTVQGRKTGLTNKKIKDLKLKGSSEVLKKGTKFKNIRLVNGDHNVDCGKIMLKSEFLKKA